MGYSNFTQNDYESNKKQIFDTIVSHIEQAIDNSDSKIYIRKLNIVDEEVDVVANSEQWPTCLDKALTFYKQIEDYESCAVCQKLIERLDKPTKKSKQKNGSKKN